MTLAKALAIERQLFALYAQASSVDRFTAATTERGVAPHTSSLASDQVIWDLRDPSLDLSTSTRPTAARGVLIRAAQLAHMRELDPIDVFVTVPDFLSYTRLITDRQRTELVRRFGARGVTSAALTGATRTIRHRGVGFWPVAAALLAGELARIPGDFGGTLLLHPYLADLAIALDRLDVLQSLLDQMRAKRRARIGLHSNLGAEAANTVLLLQRIPDVVSLLTSPNASALDTIATWYARDTRAASTALIAEVGPAPLAVHRLALSDPQRWTRHSGSIVVNALAVFASEEATVERWQRDWLAMFPGTTAPPLPWAR